MTSATLTPGRTEVRARAYERLARAVAAQHLGVTTSAVSASVHDAEGRLGIRVDAPLALRADAATDTVTSAVSAARDRIAFEVTDLTSAQLAPIDMHITRVEANATNTPAVDGSPARINRTLARRFVHRSRSTAVSLALVPVALVAAWLGSESALALLAAPPLLADPSAVVAAVATASSGASTGIALAIAGALAVLGLAALVLAVTPGRRDRRRLSSDRHVIVVDDALLASAFSARAARSASVARDQVRTALGRRTGQVAVTATSGFAVEAATVGTAVTELETALAPTPRLRLTPQIASHGRLAR